MAARDELTEIFAANLKIVREELGLTQGDMAEVCGLRYQSVYSGYELGHRKPSQHLLYTLWRMGVNLNWILTSKGSKRRVDDVMEKRAPKCFRVVSGKKIPIYD